MLSKTLIRYSSVKVALTQKIREVWQSKMYKQKIQN